MGTSRSPHPGFSRADRRRLGQALAQARDAKLYRRLRAVAEVAEGEPIATVARRARVARSTIHRWIARYWAERKPMALAEGRRSGRPRAAAALTESRLRQLLTSDPGRFGYAATTWTVPLLAAHLRAQGVELLRFRGERFAVYPASLSN
jgi:transposase